MQAEGEHGHWSWVHPDARHAVQLHADMMEDECEWDAANFPPEQRYTNSQWNKDTYFYQVYNYIASKPSIAQPRERRVWGTAHPPLMLPLATPELQNAFDAYYNTWYAPRLLAERP